MYVVIVGGDNPKVKALPLIAQFNISLILLALHLKVMLLGMRMDWMKLKTMLRRWQKHNCIMIHSK